MLRADHPQTPIQVDSGQESWDSLQEKRKMFLHVGLAEIAEEIQKCFFVWGSELTTATDEVEHWDPDRTFQRLMDE